MIYELRAYNTDCRYYGSDIRYRAYTTSEKRAKMFNQIPKIQFYDSGHGICFMSRECKFGEKRKPLVHVLNSYVSEHMSKLNRVLKAL